MLPLSCTLASNRSFGGEKTQLARFRRWQPEPQACDMPNRRLSTAARRSGKSAALATYSQHQGFLAIVLDHLAGRTFVLRGFHGYERKPSDLTDLNIAMLTALGTHASNRSLGLTQNSVIGIGSCSQSASPRTHLEATATGVTCLHVIWPAHQSPSDWRAPNPRFLNRYKTDH